MSIIVCTKDVAVFSVSPEANEEEASAIANTFTTHWLKGVARDKELAVIITRKDGTKLEYRVRETS